MSFVFNLKLFTIYRMVAVYAFFNIFQTNSFDEQGVLSGRWTETYPKDSTAPWIWTGSVAIIEKFLQTKKSVRFGQCWVFSGVTTTCKYIIISE